MLKRLAVDEAHRGSDAPENENERLLSLPLSRALHQWRGPLQVLTPSQLCFFVPSRAPYVFESGSVAAGQSYTPQPPSGPVFVKMSGAFDSLPFTSLLFSFGMLVLYAWRVRKKRVCVCVCE